MPPDYVFPFENEEIDVLRSAMKANPHDARAPYYLGNVLYDRQPEEATRAWEIQALDPSFAITHRNLATAYMHQASGADIDKAIAELEKAVSENKKYALHFTELDELYEQAGVPVEKRLKLFQANAAVVAQRDDALNRFIALQIAAGDLDDAIKTMTTHTFAVAEGANLNVSEHWTDAHILSAQAEIQAKHYTDALADLQAAATIPMNLPMSVGYGSTSGNPRYAELDYWTGAAYKGSGDAQKAAEFWRQAIAPAQRSTAMAASAAGNVQVDRRSQAFYQGLAYQELGQPEKAQEVFRGLVQLGQSDLQQPAARRTGQGRSGSAGSSRMLTANAHYLEGLGDLGLKDQTAARDELQQAVQISPDLLGARTALANIQ